MLGAKSIVGLKQELEYVNSTFGDLLNISAIFKYKKYQNITKKTQQQLTKAQANLLDSSKE